MTVLLVVGYVLFANPSEREAKRAFDSGPYQAHLLYMRGCTIGNVRREERIDTPEKEMAYCDQLTKEKTGYYVYDFNIRKSVYLDQKALRELKKHDILRFPRSIFHNVENGGNTANTITPTNQFSGFSVSCSQRPSVLECVVDGERHTVQSDKNLDLLLPRGMVTGADWHKIIRKKFFPLF